MKKNKDFCPVCKTEYTWYTVKDKKPICMECEKAKGLKVWKKIEEEQEREELLARLKPAKKTMREAVKMLDSMFAFAGLHGYTELHLPTIELMKWLREEMK